MQIAGKGASVAQKRGHDKQADVTAVADKLAGQMGYELVEAAFERERTGVYLRLYLDCEAGISLDDCEKYHRAVQPLLEQFEYDFLEVCSPGIDRPIKTERDAQKALGQQVEIRLYKPVNGAKSVEGAFLGLEDGAYVVERGGERLSFNKSDVAVCRHVPDLSGIGEE